MTDLYEKFCQDLRTGILSILPYKNKSEDSDIEAMNTNHLLVYFLNWVDRHVHPHPREVLTSKELRLNTLFSDYQADIRVIVQKIEAGEDISSHLSRSISCGYAPPPKGAPKNLNARKDLDMLLNDWGIHHLHISSHLQPDGFVERSCDLLFVIFTPARAYLLDIQPHGAWSNQQLVGRAINNWPNDNLYSALDVLPSRQEWTNDDYKKIRGAGVSTTVNVNGKSYFSRTLGISTAGTTSRASIQSIRFLAYLKQLSEQIEKNPEYLKPDVERAGGEWPVVPEYKLIFVSRPHGYNFEIAIENANIGIGIWRLYT